jgi:hypothetical protein
MMACALLNACPRSIPLAAHDNEIRSVPLPIDQDPVHAPKAAAEFVYRREGILQAYQRTYHCRSSAVRLQDTTKLSLAAVDVWAHGLASVIASPCVASRMACASALTMGHGRVPS